MRMPLSRRSMIMLCVALVSGLCAAWAARQHIQGRIQQIEEEARVPMVERVVAAYDLAPGTRIGPEHVAVRQFPRGLSSSDSLTPERYREIEGSLLIAPLRAGDPILLVHAAAEHHAPFSGRLGLGRRAITMPVDTINSVSGLLEPGDLIDLYVSFDYQRRRVTAPLLQGVLVLATGTNSGQGERASAHTGGYSTVTLDTSPEDAIKLVAARQGGTITALLRRPDDGQPTQKAVRGDLASLLGVNTSLPVPRAKNAPVIYGDRPGRSVASLQARPVNRQASGIFDLPYRPELVSAWLNAAIQEEAGFGQGSTASGMQEPNWTLAEHLGESNVDH